MPRARTSLRIAAIVAIIAVGGLIQAVAVPLGAVAFWQATATASRTVSGAVLGTPVTCCTPVTIVLANDARVSWAAIPNAASYEVFVQTPGGATRESLGTTTGTTTDIGATLLGGLIPGLLALLLGGGTIEVVVQARHTSGWTSAMSTPLLIKRTGLLPGVLGGITCA